MRDFASIAGENVAFCDRRTRVHWGEFSVVQATLDLMTFAMAAAPQHRIPNSLEPLHRRWRFSDSELMVSFGTDVRLVRFGVAHADCDGAESLHEYAAVRKRAGQGARASWMYVFAGPRGMIMPDCGFLPPYVRGVGGYPLIQSKVRHAATQLHLGKK